MEYTARFRLCELDVRPLRHRTFRPRLECLTQTRFHRLGIEVAGDAEDDVVGINELLMPADQVLTCYRGDGRVFRNARVRVVFAVDDDAALASDDGVDVIVTAGNRGVHLPLGELQLVGTELGIVQQIEIHLEDGVEVALQAVERDGGRVGLIIGLDLGGARFEEIVHFVAGLTLRPASSPDIAVKIGEAGLVRRLVNRAPANASGCADQRQFVVGLKEDDHAVRQLNTRRLGRRECRQRRCCDLVPWSWLLG